MAKAKKITCVKHGAELVRSAFYMATPIDSVFAGVGVIPICKTCLLKMAEAYYDKYQDYEISIYYMCRKVDIAFDSAILEGALKSGGNDIKRVFSRYMTQFNSLGSSNNAQLSFDDGEHLYNMHKIQEEDHADESADSIKDSDLDNIKMSAEDKRNKEEVISLIEYDPFEGFPESDQKFLYSDLLNYFGDEDVVEDQFLVSQIIQVVNNNNQIRKLDYLLSKYMADNEKLSENAGIIKSLNATKKDIVMNTDKIAKENRISVKSRVGSNISKSSLTVMMERLRSLGFEDAEVDFYDQKKAYGMQRVADISMKAIENQLQFDENDIGYMIAEQRNIIKEMEEKILDLEEENRRLHKKLQDYK